LRRLAPLPALAAAVLLAAACGSPPERPNLLIVVSDALRADALSCYGGRAATPNLCRLADRGVLFENAFANAPWTLPSSISMFTGRPPGWYRQVAGPEDLESGARFYRVPDDERLLGEVLGDLGYLTLVRLENPVARQAKVFQGFGEAGFGEARKARALAGLAPDIGFTPRDGRYFELLWLLDLLSSPPAGKFAAIHWIDDPHAPYLPPAGLLPEEAAAGLPRPLDYYTGLGHHNRPGKGIGKLREEVAGMTSEELAFVERLYLLEVESVDERVGHLLGALEYSGLSEETLVVFTSDHGEAFGEHGDYLHGVSLFNELIRVPLIAAGPGIARGHRIASPVSHLDLLPTLADLMRLEGLGPFAGESLRRQLEGSSERRPRYHYLSSPDRLDHDGVVHGRYKLLAGFGRDAGDVELYDYVADPAEARNAVAELPEVRRRLLQALLRFRREEERSWLARSADGEGALSEAERAETERALRAVGYLD
jgi:arylsulfatase A-like enzyme